MLKCEPANISHYDECLQMMYSQAPLCREDNGIDADKSPVPQVKIPMGEGCGADGGF
ncbi:MAG: hypothetical protein NTV06_04245 [candidate division Zixibacteria bacterium]|nr:hypothetical protein [candidate division Zixibacteria bacterium]